MKVLFTLSTEIDERPPLVHVFHYEEPTFRYCLLMLIHRLIERIPTDTRKGFFE